MPRVALADLNDRWWDWRIASWDGWTLVVIADNDLTYHHVVEVIFRGVEYVSSPIDFSHPAFREPTSAEVERVTRALNGDLDELQVFAWDIDSDPPEACLIAAEAVEVTEGLVPHEQPSS